MNANTYRVAAFLAVIASVVLGHSAAAADAPRVVKVFAVYATPIEEPWNTVIHSAFLASREKGHIEYTWKDKVEKPAALEKLLREQATKNAADLIVGDATTDEEMVRKVAAEFPKVAFVFGSAQGPKEPNFSTFDSTLHEPAYLCGLIAGKVTKSNVVGIVAGYSDDDDNRTINGFIQGVKETNPRAKVKVTFIQSWFDPPKAKKAALEQVEAGADVFFAEREGTIEVAKQKKALAFGYLTDQSAEGPDTVITGPVWDMRPIVQRVVRQVAEGKFKAEDLRKYTALANGSASLAPWHGWDKKLPAEVMQLVREKEAAIKSGSLRINPSTEKPKSD